MRTQPVIAYRIWKVSPEGRLYTAYRDSGKWPWMKPYSAACDRVNTFSILAGVFESAPIPDDHDAPHFDCTCGLYGYKSVKCLEQTFDMFYKGNCVLGRVALWGHVVEHTDGYRAEYGYPQVLYVSNTENNWTILSAAQKYGIDTAPLPEEIKVAFSQFFEKKRLKEEKERQYREAQEKMARADDLWVDEIKYTAPYHSYQDQFPKEWEKKNEALKKHFKPYTGKSLFPTNFWKGNI